MGSLLIPCSWKITHNKLTDADKSAILVREIVSSIRTVLTQICASQELMSEEGDVSLQVRTQLSKGDISIEVSHPSLVVQHGATAAQAHIKAKPKFAEYLCSPFRVGLNFSCII